MTIEQDVFKRYSPKFDKLTDYGFIKADNVFKYEKMFKDNLFKAVITINSNGNITGVVYDIENDDEFLPLRVENSQGAYTGEVKDAYKSLLMEIRDNCFRGEYFIFAQTNRIASKIMEKYGDEPEFLWEKFKGSAIFRNKKTKKWYAVFMDVDRSKIQKDKKGLIEVIDLKLSPEHISELIENEKFYYGYHMNKKYWISVILDETVEDEEIMKLIEESYFYSKNN